MIILGWILVALPVILAVYTYVVYPSILWLMGRVVTARTFAVAEPWPMVSIVVPAYNEEGQIRGTLDALLRQDYPADRRQILILSDASSDATDDIVREYAPRGIELMRMPSRVGKTAAENACCHRLRGDIVVNSDASVRMRPNAVRLLVEAMADPTVGVASTRDMSVSGHQVAANEAEAGYVGYEMRIRQMETIAGGIVGASGSGYAIRRSIHDIPLPEMLSRDFSAALTARSHGYRAVSVDDAITNVPRTSSIQHEYRRKVRTISRGIDTLVYWRRLLDPMRYGSFAWKLWSHKVCRWLIPVSTVPAIVGLLILAPSEMWARVALAGVAAAGAVVVIARQWPAGRPIPRIISLGAFGISANAAVVHAVFRILFGHGDHVWEPTRRPSTIASV
jgi:cellulose synthase/poly-beta-1,6-N-acetylglucosamine synthase-like glycosyltransferase